VSQWGLSQRDLSIGTAVRPIRDDHSIPQPQLVLGLDT